MELETGRGLWDRVSNWELRTGNWELGTGLELRLSDCQTGRREAQQEEQPSVPTASAN